MKVYFEMEIEDYGKWGAAELAKRLRKIMLQLMAQKAVVPVLLPDVEMSLEIDRSTRTVDICGEQGIRLAKRIVREKYRMKIPLPMWWKRDEAGRRPDGSIGGFATAWLAGISFDVCPGGASSPSSVAAEAD